MGNIPNRNRESQLPPCLQNWILMTKKDVYDLVCYMNEKCSALATNDRSKVQFSLNRHIDEESVFQWKLLLRINCCVRQPSENEYTASQVVKTFTLMQFTTLCLALIPLLNSTNSIDGIHDQLTNRVTEAPDVFVDPVLTDKTLYINDECVICCENKADSILPCTHLFCSRCVSRMQHLMKIKCPLCRQQFSADDAWEAASIPKSGEIYSYIMDSVNTTPGKAIPSAPPDDTRKTF